MDPMEVFKIEVTGDEEFDTKKYRELIMDILQDLGLSPGSLLLTGGGARSPFVRKLQSEVYGLPVQTVNREEGGSYGAALLGAVLGRPCRRRRRGTRGRSTSVRSLTRCRA